MKPATQPLLPPPLPPCPPGGDAARWPALWAEWAPLAVAVAGVLAAWWEREQAQERAAEVGA